MAANGKTKENQTISDGLLSAQQPTELWASIVMAD
jgi:hypothetical protein